MNREIRFRCWSDDDKCMVDLVDMMKTGFKHLNEQTFARLLNRLFLPVTRMHLMQFTGLKDKSGRDIYEGDVVRLMDQGVQRTAEVKWGKGIAGFFLYRELPYWRGNLSGGGKDNDQETCEVIGNIFENPELLLTEVTTS